MNDCFGQQEAGGEFIIIAWGAHGDGQGAITDANFERLLGCQFIDGLLEGTV